MVGLWVYITVKHEKMIVRVYNTMIESAHIIGVGPIIRVVPTDDVSVVFWRARFEFVLYLVGYNAVITTDLLSFRDDDKENSTGELNRLRRSHTAVVQYLETGSIPKLGTDTGE